MSAYQFDDVWALRRKADALRAQAEATRSHDPRRIFLRLAAGYDGLADRAEGAPDVVKRDEET